MSRGSSAVNGNSYLEIDLIQQLVADFYNISLARLLSANRTTHVSLTRQVGMYLTRKFTQHSLPEIGMRFNRDHSTVIHGINLVAKKERYDDIFATTLFTLKKIVEDRLAGIREPKLNLVGLGQGLALAGVSIQNARAITGDPLLSGEESCDVLNEVDGRLLTGEQIESLENQPFESAEAVEYYK